MKEEEVMAKTQPCGDQKTAFRRQRTERDRMNLSSIVLEDSFGRNCEETLFDLLTDIRL